MFVSREIRKVSNCVIPNISLFGGIKASPVGPMQGEYPWVDVLRRNLGQVPSSDRLFVCGRVPLLK